MSSRPSTGFGSKPTPRASGGGGGHGSRDGGQHVTLNEQGVATLQEKSKGGFICKMRFAARTLHMPHFANAQACGFDETRSRLLSYGTCSPPLPPARTPS